MSRFIASTFTLAILTAPHADAQIAIVPAAPRAQETVMLTVAEGVIGRPTVNLPPYNTYNTRATRVEMQGNKINVSVELFNNEFGSPSEAMKLPLGQLPAGTYEVELTRRLPDGTSAGVVGTRTFTVSHRTPSDPLWNHTDIWWNPSESGWGLSIVQHGSGIIFATWYVYGADGRATWHVVPEGQWFTPHEYRGPLYRTTGPQIPYCSQSSCPPFNAQAVGATLVGTARLAFDGTDANRAVAIFTTTEGTVSREIRRQSF